MLRAALLHYYELRRGQLAAAHQVQQRADEIGVLGRDGGLGRFERFGDDPVGDESARGIDSAVQIQRRDQRLDGVYQQRGLGAAAAELLAAAHHHVIAQAQARGHAG